MVIVASESPVEILMAHLHEQSCPPDEFDFENFEEPWGLSRTCAFDHRQEAIRILSVATPVIERNLRRKWESEMDAELAQRLQRVLMGLVQQTSSHGRTEVGISP